MIVYIISRDINGQRHSISFNEKTRETAWIVKESLKLHPGFGRVGWKTRDLAEQRAREFGGGAYVTEVTI